MNRLAYTAFVAFWASVLTLLAVGLLAPDAPPAVEAERPPLFTLDDVAGHDSETSCWIAVEGQVYDVTDYLPLHPTSPGILLEWCGREATRGMRTKGYGPDHTARAWAQLDEYLIGRLQR